jgi:hypothetical protein
MLHFLPSLFVFYQLADGLTGAPGASLGFYTSATSHLLISYFFQAWIGCRNLRCDIPVVLVKIINLKSDAWWSKTQLYSYIIYIKYIPGCLKSKCTDFLFNYLLDLLEITSYLLQSMTLGKLHSGSSVSFTDHSSPGSHFL